MWIYSSWFFPFWNSENNIALQIWTFCVQVFPKVFLGFKNFPSRQIFEKKGIETLKNSVCAHFWKIVELNTDVLEPSLVSEIDNWFLLFKMSPTTTELLRKQNTFPINYK